MNAWLASSEPSSHYDFLLYAVKVSKKQTNEGGKTADELGGMKKRKNRA
jgi:hypothetical protein